jgi:hypothetical protein
MIGLLIVALLLLIYLPVVHGHPVMDDEAVIFRDERWVSKNYRGLIYKAYFTYRGRLIGYYRPIYRALTALTLLPCRNIEALHLGSVVIHGAGVVVAYFLAAALGYDPVRAALIFAVHPIASEAVANSCRRSSVLSGVLWGLTALCVVTGHYYLAVGAFGLALLAKEDAAGFFGAAIQEQLVKQDLGAESMKAAGLDVPLPQPIYTITSVVGHVIRIPLWLFGLNQNVDHHVKPPTVREFVYFTFIFWVFFSFAPLHIILLFVLSPLVGYFFVPIQDIVVEHRAYTLTFIFALLASAFLSYLPIGVTAAVVGIFAAQSAIRAYNISTLLRFWNSAYQGGSKKKLRVLIMLGNAYQHRHEVETAMGIYREILQTYPRQGVAMGNIALIHIMNAQKAFAIADGATGKAEVEEAWRCIRKAREWMPDEKSINEVYQRVRQIKEQVEVAEKEQLLKVG